MADEQASTLAFLQHFYTDVTLYVPFEAPEHTPAEAAAPQPVATAVVAAEGPATAPVLTVPVAATVAPALGKLPALAGVDAPVGAATPATPVAVAPTAMPGIAAPTTTPPVAPYLLTTFDTLGSNAHGVVLLVRLPPEQFVKLPRNVFLNKLLQAINLVMADVVLVNVDGPYPVALSTLRKEIAATHILAFGKNLLDVAVRTTQIYEPVKFPALGLAYLAGAEVELIEYDVSLKKRLWNGLKSMFLN